MDWENELKSLVGAYHLVVPIAVVKELQMLASRGAGQKKAAAALKLIEKFETIDEDSLHADEALLKIAQKTNGIVVTNDTMLRHLLKKQGNPVIFLRGKKKLVLDE